ncbi:VOC family protein [Nonomuraea guangzhouensis]|uniref:VOC family protein n=1 Tax=Nonomuraea guangzhouensis TaxID=1291555 RepID=A0ABW4G6C9_9ACTN|nr:VOC family protein [Nonomuraea guangzhouensis]
MRLKLSSYALAVHDVNEALGFYRDVLGFEVRELGGTRWVRVGPPSEPDVQIFLEAPGADPGVSPADRQAIEDLMAKGLLGRLVFVTDDCDATFERIEAAGAEVIQERPTASATAPSSTPPAMCCDSPSHGPRARWRAT